MVEPSESLVVREHEPHNPFELTRDDAAGALVDSESARAIAQVQAALVIAKRFPRDQARAMDLILQDCGLPALAEAASYDYKRAGTAITGPTIRLAEAIARRWGNLECAVVELGRHDGYSECMSYAWDLETTYREVRTFQVKHWRDTKQGGYKLTDERDIYELVANMGARRKRACILAIIPPDVIDNAVAQCEKTMRTKVNVTNELLTSLLEKFAKHGVTREHIETRVQRRFVLENVTPAMVVQLGKIYNSLEEGASVVSDWFKGEAKVEDVTKAGRKRPVAKKEPEPTPDAPDPAATVASAASAEDLAFLRKKMDVATITEAEVCKTFGLAKLEDLRAAVVPAVIKWLGDPTSKPA